MDTKKPHIRLTSEVYMMLRYMRELELEIEHQSRHIAALAAAIKITAKSFNEDIETLYEHVFEDELRKRMFNY